MNAPDLAGHEWWLASRAAGIVAMILVSVSVGLGLANAAKLIPPRSRRALIAIHEQSALAALVAIAAHGLLLLPDSWLHPGVGIAVPFVIDYRPLAVAAGIVAGYGAALLGLSFYLRRKIGARLWRKLHMGTLGVYLLALIHTITAGTDAGTPWLLGILGATVAPILGLLAFRATAKPAPRAAA
jgi:methionine sulfoxide reductase heme-binding subunit